MSSVRQPGVGIPGGMILVIVVLLTAGGCGRAGTVPTAAVAGRVLFQGAPVGNVTITFTPADGRPATGSVDAEGRFRLSTFATGDGAVVGKHRVTFGSVEVPPMPGTPDAKGFKPPPPPFPKRYAGLSTTDLEIDVPAAGLPDVLIELQP